MKKNKILFILSLLLISFEIHAKNVKYILRRFDDNEDSDIEYVFYNDQDNSDNEIIKNNNKKTKKYDGYYKVGGPYTVLGQTYYPKEDPTYEEVGMASWYGSDFHNKKTANGEKYNMNDYTAAHRTLPMPCIVKVTNLENGKSVNVRINDRGPFAKNRIIDVSKKVAKKLDFHDKGTTKVKVEFLQKETDQLLKDYGLK